MHELSIAQALIEQVQAIAEKEHGEVFSITVSIGSLSGVESESLEQAFLIAVEDTPLQNAKLVTEKVPAKVTCHSCKSESTPEFPFFACQSCGSTDFEIVAGHDMILKSVELCS